MVVFYLVLRGASPLFRSESAIVAHFTGLEFDYWSGALFEHNRGGGESGQTRFLEDAQVVSHAFLRFEFCGDGQGTGVRADFLATPE